MVATDRVQEIFDDAKATYRDVLERLAAGDIRDAAERHGELPSGPPTP